MNPMLVRNCKAPFWGPPLQSRERGRTQRNTRILLAANTQGILLRSSRSKCISRRRQWIRPQGSKARGFYVVKGSGVGNSAQQCTIDLFKHQQKNYMYVQVKVSAAKEYVQEFCELDVYQYQQSIWSVQTLNCIKGQWAEGGAGPDGC